MLASVVIVRESVTPVDILTLVAISVGVVVAAGGLWTAALAERRQAKIAESEHLMGMLRRWSEMHLQEARHLVDKYDDGERVLRAMDECEHSRDEKLFVFLRILAFFEDLGILARDLKVVEVRSVKNSLRSAIEYYWEKYEPYIRRQRELQKAADKEQTNYEWFEKLKNAVE